MTLNFGHKITIGFLAFVGMMVYLVVSSMQTKYDLVSTEYYKEELQYQQVIDGTTRANQLSTKSTITQTNDQLTLQLPNEMKKQTVTGTLHFYSADNAQKDKKMALQVNGDGTQQIDGRSFIAGNYTVKLAWESNGVAYYTEMPLTIH